MTNTLNCCRQTDRLCPVVQGWCHNNEGHLSSLTKNLGDKTKAEYKSGDGDGEGETLTPTDTLP